MDSKPPLQGRPLRRKVHVVYYLSRGGGQMDHPHLLEGYLSAAQDGLRLRDFKRWLAVLRGKSMPTSFAWSYKRSYKNGFIWHDLGDNDLIQPLSKNEYVLMGSEIKEQGANVVRCKCGGIQQQMDTKVVEEVGDIQQEPSLNKPLTRSPKPITKSGSYNVEDYRSVGGLSPGIMSSPVSRLGLIATENKFHDSGTDRMMNKSSLYSTGGGSSRSFNDLTAQRLLEEVKKSTINNHNTKQLVTLKSSNSAGHTRQNSKVSIRNCEIIAEEDHHIDEGARRENVNHNHGNHTCAYVKQATFSSKLSGENYNDAINEEHYKSDDVSSVDHDNEDDINGIFIMDAATQTGDSTRCSTEDHQDGIDSADYRNMIEVVHSPGESAKISGARRVSSARFNSSHHSHGHAVKGNLSMHLSQDFSDLPDVDKSITTRRQPSEAHVNQNVGNASSSNHTSLQNNMGSPGALSSCSAMSARSSTRFAREENNRTPLPNTSNKSTRKYSVKPEHHHHHQRHHHHSKGTSSQSSSGNIGPNASSPAPAHTLLKQLLTCGNADVVSEKKPNNVTENVMVMNNNALSGLQTPSRGNVSATPYHQETDKSKNGIWAACKTTGLMKRISSNTAASSTADNRSVISATATSEQGSMRDMLEMVSSPESVCASNRHLKSNMMKAHSFSASSAAAALQSDGLRLSSVGASHSGSSVSRRILQQLPSAVGPAAGSTSPGVFSVASSTSRRSSIRDNEVTVMEGGDVEEGLQEALRSHHIGVNGSSKSRAGKGNKNTLLKKGNLDHKEASYNNEGLGTITTNVNTESNSHSTNVSELHKLICNPNSTPPCVNHNKVTSSNSIMPQVSSYNYHQTYIQNNTKDSYTPRHLKSHETLITTHGHSRNTARSSNLNSPNMSILSKSLNSPSSLIVERRVQASNNSSPHITSWKDLLWSPRNNFSQKEKERRHMKP